MFAFLPESSRLPPRYGCASAVHAQAMNSVNAMHRALHTAVPCCGTWPSSRHSRMPLPRITAPARRLTASGQRGVPPLCASAPLCSSIRREPSRPQQLRPARSCAAAALPAAQQDSHRQQAGSVGEALAALWQRFLRFAAAMAAVTVLALAACGQQHAALAASARFARTLELARCALWPLC